MPACWSARSCPPPCTLVLTRLAWDLSCRLPVCLPIVRGVLENRERQAQRQMRELMHLVQDGAIFGGGSKIGVSGGTTKYSGATVEVNSRFDSEGDFRARPCGHEMEPWSRPQGHPRPRVVRKSNGFDCWTVRWAQTRTSKCVRCCPLGMAQTRGGLDRWGGLDPCDYASGHGCSESFG
ncbi:unnamed protein product [Prunus armeniaca]